MFGSKELLRALKEAGVPPTGAAEWLRGAVNDTEAVADFLANERGISPAMFYALARVLPPDAVPNDYGPDPWLIAFRNAIGTTSDQDSTYLAA